MEWPEKKMLSLVETYKLFKNLWDPKDKDYFKKEKKIDAWNTIASAIERSVEATKKKMTSLLATYRKEKNRVKLSMGTGKGSDEVYSSRWFAYETFQFLEDRDRPRQGLNTEHMTDTEEEIERDNSQQEENDDEMHNVQETKSSSIAITRNKRVKKRDQLQHSFMEDAIGLMKTAASKLQTPFSDTPEEVKSFGNYIVSKMKSYSSQTRKGVEHAIFDILIKADSGYYENSIPSTSTAPPPHHLRRIFPIQPEFSLQYPQPYIPNQMFPTVSKQTQRHVNSIPSPIDSQYSGSTTPSPCPKDSLPQQSSLLIHSQPPLQHQTISKHNSTAVISPSGHHCSINSPFHLSPECITQQHQDSSTTYSQPHIHNQNVSSVYNQHCGTESSSQGSIYSSNTPSPRSPEFVHQQPQGP